MPNLFRLLDALWTLAMGLFLGLAGGLVFAVILAFRGSRHMQASPGLSPYADSRFANYHADAVAGYIGQKLFMVGGSAALILLTLAVLARLINFGLTAVSREVTGSFRLSIFQLFLLAVCVLSFVSTAVRTVDMNASWPGLYDTQASDTQLAERRSDFELQHKQSEHYMRVAWLAGFVALAVSPWCEQRRSTPRQPRHRGEESGNKEN